MLPNNLTSKVFIFFFNDLKDVLFISFSIYLELIQRIMPTPEEIKAYKDYTVVQKKDLEKLTEEDR